MNIKTYSASTAKYIKTIDAYLIGKYGSTKPEWEAIIVILADNLELYKKIKKSIEENGVFDDDRYIKNPLLSTLKDIQASIMKQIQHLGLSPYALGKLSMEKEDDEDDFLARLEEKIA